LATVETACTSFINIVFVSYFNEYTTRES